MPHKAHLLHHSFASPVVWSNADMCLTHPGEIKGYRSRNVEVAIRGVEQYPGALHIITILAISLQTNLSGNERVIFISERLLVPVN